MQVASSTEFKIPPAGRVPRFGDFHAHHLYEVAVGGGWHIDVDANGPEQAADIAKYQGYTVFGVASK